MYVFIAGGRKRENEDEEVGRAEQEYRNDSMKNYLKKSSVAN